MSPDELQFLEDAFAATELLLCHTCAQPTLHAHQEVMEVQLAATDLLMQCTHCATERRWLDWNSPQLARNQQN